MSSVFPTLLHKDELKWDKQIKSVSRYADLLSDMGSSNRGGSGSRTGPASIGSIAGWGGGGGPPNDGSKSCKEEKNKN